jgi:hypothetical protein
LKTWVFVDFYFIEDKKTIILKFFSDMQFGLNSTLMECLFPWEFVYLGSSYLR